MGIFWHFWGFLMILLMPIWVDGPTFCFTHADNYYKAHYKLLTPCVYLRFTLSILKNGKNHIFSVIEVLVHDSHRNMLYGQMGVRLMDR